MQWTAHRLVSTGLSGRVSKSTTTDTFLGPAKLEGGQSRRPVNSSASRRAVNGMIGKARQPIQMACSLFRFQADGRLSPNFRMGNLRVLPWEQIMQTIEKAHILNDVVIPIFCGGGDCTHYCSSFNI
ncbi:unnamed protein product [Ectocarpus sp. 13 AM-2016]